MLIAKLKRGKEVGGLDRHLNAQWFFRLSPCELLFSYTNAFKASVSLSNYLRSLTRIKVCDSDSFSKLPSDVPNLRVCLFDGNSYFLILKQIKAWTRHCNQARHAWSKVLESGFLFEEDEVYYDEIVNSKLNALEQMRDEITSRVSSLPIACGFDKHMRPLLPRSKRAHFRLNRLELQQLKHNANSLETNSSALLRALISIPVEMLEPSADSENGVLRFGVDTVVFERNSYQSLVNALRLTGTRFNDGVHKLNYICSVDFRRPLTTANIVEEAIGCLDSAISDRDELIALVSKSESLVHVTFSRSLNAPIPVEHAQALLSGDDSSAPDALPSDNASESQPSGKR